MIKPNAARLMHRFIAAMLSVCCLLGGCRNSVSTPEDTSALTQAERENAAGTLKLAARGSDWKRAWEATEILLDERGLDHETGQPKDVSNPAAIPASRSSKPLSPMTWALMASVAHESGRSRAAAHFLACACRADRFANTPGIERAMVAMIEAGMLTEGMAFLQEALVFKPGEQNIRRLLFDLTVGTEDRVAAMPLAKELIYARKFDVPLLLAIANTERRTDDPEPLKVVAARNPDDRRPLLGVAKVTFDLGELEEAIEELTAIVDAHPDFQPAQAILGQAYVAAGRLEELEKWAHQQVDGIQRYPAYWIALGDWAREKGQTTAAVRCFLEATRTEDPDGLQVWTRLATLIPQLEDATLLEESTATRIQDRAKTLARLSALQDRFDRTGRLSREIVLDIGTALRELGRRWEAEAWLAVGTTLPEDDTVDLETPRAELAKELHRETPWQVRKGYPEFAIELASFPLPEIEQVVRQGVPEPQTAETSLPPNLSGEVIAHWKMEDRAEAFGLRFFGRTGDKLDEPGVMLYQTLGCGGGTIDFDRDGWADLYLAAAGGTPPEQDSAPNELFRNLGGTFSAVGENARVDDRGFGQGIAVGDINEDGFADLLVLNYGPNRLLVNQGDGTFVDARLPSEAYDEWSTSGAIADIDGDGLSDLFLVNYCSGLGPVIQSCQATCSPMVFPAVKDRVVQGTREGDLLDVSTTWLGEVTEGRGLGLIVGDLDSSPGNEVFVANDMTSNHFYSVDPKAPDFELLESATPRGVGGDDRGLAQGSMGIATADFDGDEDLDFYVTNFDGEYNTLHVQTGPGIWRDRTAALGLSRDTLPRVGFGVEAIDFDNSGSESLVVLNGHVDIFSRAGERVTYAQPAQVFRRGLEQTFRSVDVGSLGDYFSKPHVGRSLWTIDANNDGRVDLVATHQTEPVALLLNESKTQNDWFRVELVGTHSSRDAVGARVTVANQTEPRRCRFRVAGGGYQCSNDRLLHFGLAESGTATVEFAVDWPSGRQETFQVSEPRKTAIFVEGEGLEQAN